MVKTGDRARLSQQQLEEQWERDNVAITAKLLWFYARYNLLHLCGVIDPAPYLSPRGLVRLAWVFCDTDRGRYTGEKPWVPRIEKAGELWASCGESWVSQSFSAEEVKRADTQMEG